MPTKNKINAEDLPAIVKGLRRVRDAELAAGPYTIADKSHGLREARIWGPVNKLVQLFVYTHRDLGVLTYGSRELDPALPQVVRDKLEELREAFAIRLAGHHTRLKFWEDGIAVLSAGHGPADGPVPPDKFAWKGVTCGGLAKLQFHLLSYLWNGGDPIRCLSYEDARERVWGADREDGSIKSYVNRLARKLRKAPPSGVDFGLRVDNYEIVADW